MDLRKREGWDIDKRGTNKFVDRRKKGCDIDTRGLYR